ncbi:MAG: DUF2007 domain-containing protein [Gammaproteobacteria bacterium]|nr:DUF2007 domain-containing protein [Gammaproteobacteria bacterium]
MMKLIYTNEDRFMVWGVKNTLELAGYDCHIRNEYAAGGAGDIAPIETWPEVWLENEEQFEEALNYLESNILNKMSCGKDWICNKCEEANGSSFEFCWNCGTEFKTNL